ncbi:MAG: hypothetical protein EBR09_13560 [Proteobacteria bacterium]|nr:hypothetical protein [Pseudomonadota bacterium]
MKALSPRSVALLAAVGIAGLTGSLVSCGTDKGIDSDVSALAGLESVDFPTWCRDFALQNCNVQPDDRVPADQWQAGVDVFAELMKSNTTISLTRADFDRKTVQDLFSTFGANSLLSFISKIPWQKLEKSDDALVLSNASANAVAIFNGLRLIGSARVVAKFTGPQLVSISGLSVADSRGGQVSAVRFLDLSKPSRISIATDYEKFENIPVQFFQVPGFQQPPALTPSAAFNAIANVVLEPGFDWRKNLNIFLKGTNLNNIYNRISKFIPEGPADDTTRQVIGNTDVFMVGGVSSNILLSIQMKKALKCTAKVRNIPILGSLDFDINFLKGFGLSDLQRIKADGVKTRVYGISTSIGNIDNIEVDSKQLRMRVGAFTIPIDFVPAQGNGRGPAVDGVKCE